MASILPVLKCLKPRFASNESWESFASWKLDTNSTKEPQEDGATTGTHEVANCERSDSFEMVNDVESPTLDASNDNCQFEALAKSFYALPPRRYKGNKNKDENANATANSLIAKELEDIIPDNSSVMPFPVSGNSDNSSYDHDHDIHHHLELERKALFAGKVAAGHSDDGNHSVTERFPDYYESCEGDDLKVEDSVHEAAYNYALSKVAEAAKDPANFHDAVTGTDDDDKRKGESNGDSSVNVQFSWELEPEFDGTVGVCHRDATPSHSTHETADIKTLRKLCLTYEDAEEEDDDEDFDPEHEDQLSASSQTLSASTFVDGVYRGRLLNDLEKMLANPNILPSVRQQFSFMTNMVLRMNHAMFHSHKLVLERDHFLSGAEKVEVREMACQIIDYVSFLEGQLQEHVDIAGRVDRMLLEVSKDEKASPFVLYKRMARVAAKNLRKPRTYEKHLLHAFVKLYENYVYNAFLEIKTRHATQKDKNPPNQPQQQQERPTSSSSSSPNCASETNDDNNNQDPEKVKLYDSLVELWNTLIRANKNYDSYVASLNGFVETYLSPVMAEMVEASKFTKEELLKDDELN